MAEIRWTPQAADDLDAAAEYIAADSPHYASLFALDILQAVEKLAQFPRLGRVVPELGNPEVRELLLGNYRIVYRVRPDVAEILTIYHASRILDPEILKTDS